MKKVLPIFIAVVVLTGCGTNEMLTCTSENKVGNITSKTTYIVDYKDNDVKKITITYDYNDDHTDGVSTGTDGTTKDDIKNDEDTTTNNTDNDGLIGGLVGETLDDIVEITTDTILDVAGIKEKHNTRYGTYANIEGFTTKVDKDNANDYKVIYTYDLTKLSEADITSLGITRNYDTLKQSYINRGLTCK